MRKANLQLRILLINGKGETDFCLGFVAQWFVHWLSFILGLIPDGSQSFSFPISLLAIDLCISYCREKKVLKCCKVL